MEEKGCVALEWDLSQCVTHERGLLNCTHSLRESLAAQKAETAKEVAQRQAARTAAELWSERYALQDHHLHSLKDELERKKPFYDPRLQKMLANYRERATELENALTTLVLTERRSARHSLPPTQAKSLGPRASSTGPVMNGCGCACHRGEGVKHFTACCNGVELTQAERLQEQGRVVLRVSAEIRSYLTGSLGAEDDEDAITLTRDLDALDEVGRWLAGTTPISLPITLRTAPEEETE